MTTTENVNEVLNVGIFEIVAALCFTKNKALWSMNSDEYPVIDDIKNGKKYIDLNKENPGPGISKFLTGLMFFAFYNYDSIGNQYLSVAKIKESSNIEIVFFDGKKYRFNVNDFDDNAKQFFARSFELLLGKNNLILDKNVFVGLSKMFRAAYARLNKEADYFKRMFNHRDYMDFFTANDISITSLCLVLSSLPQSQLNMLLMKFANYIDPELEIKTGNGVIINAKSFLGYDTVDLSELNNKVRVILLLHQMDKKIVGKIFNNNDMLNKLIEFISNQEVDEYIRSSLKDALDGQYQPRIDVIKSFLKIIDVEN